MIDERAFLAQLESSNTDELSQILRRPSADEERLLEIYFGAERLHRLRSLALGPSRMSTEFEKFEGASRGGGGAPGITTGATNITINGPWASMSRLD